MYVVRWFIWGCLAIIFSCKNLRSPRPSARTGPQHWAHCQPLRWIVTLYFKLTFWLWLTMKPKKSWPPNLTSFSPFNPLMPMLLKVKKKNSLDNWLHQLFPIMIQYLNLSILDLENQLPCLPLPLLNMASLVPYWTIDLMICSAGSVIISSQPGIGEGAVIFPV